MRKFDIQVAAGKYDLGPDRRQQIPLTAMLDILFKQYGASERG